MYFGIYNNYEIKNIKPKGKKTILIRCLSKSEYKNMDITLPNKNDYIKILTLNIEDSNEFDIDNAKILNEFIINNDFDEVISHCALGLSRSPAIMICISKILNYKELEEIIKENYKFYNKFIVNEFEKYPYKIKKINESNIIIETPKKEKQLAKVIDSIIIN